LDIRSSISFNLDLFLHLFRGHAMPFVKRLALASR
jgi:hypothetical protein